MPNLSGKYGKLLIHQTFTEHLLWLYLVLAPINREKWMATFRCLGEGFRRKNTGLRVNDRTQPGREKHSNPEHTANRGRGWRKNWLSATRGAQRGQHVCCMQGLIQQGLGSPSEDYGFYSKHDGKPPEGW